MSPQPTQTRLDRLCALLTTYYRLHLWAFVAGNLLLTAINIYSGAPWWALWPLLIWGVPFSVHFFIFKSLTVTEEWVDERIDDLHWRSYDLGHVEDLEDRIRADDFSTRPAHRRDPDWWQQPKHDEQPDASASPADADDTSKMNETSNGRDDQSTRR